MSALVLKTGLPQRLLFAAGACLLLIWLAVDSGIKSAATDYYDRIASPPSAKSVQLVSGGLRVPDAPPPGPDLTFLKEAYAEEHAGMTARAQEGAYTLAADSKLCVVARTYRSQMSYLPITLLSLFHSGFPDTQVFLVNTDSRKANISYFAGAIDLVNTLAGKADFAVFLPFESDVVGDYGYTLTDEALQHLYNHPEHRCTHVMFTNGDNFYVKDFGAHTRRALHAGASMIGYNFISRYSWNAETLHKRKGVANIWEHDDGHSKLLQTEFAEYHIDLGAAIFQLSFLKENGLTFWEGGEGVGYTDRADGHFVQKALSFARRAWLLRSVLFVHQ